MDTRYRRRRAATAYHEAGHAVIAHVLGCQVMLVSIVRQGTTRGRARSDSPGDPEQNAWILLAGPTAQWMSGYCTRRTVWRYLWRVSDGEDLGELLDRVATSDAEKWATCCKWLESAAFLLNPEAEIPMSCVPSGVIANFAIVPKLAESARKSPREFGKTAVAGEFCPQRGLTKGY
jgi:hypothetical protein